ncbi:Uncharacterised protein r2_g481 [Pycnogonum litorale]
MEPNIDSELLVQKAVDDEGPTNIGRMKIFLYRNVGVISGIFCGICNASIVVSGKSLTKYYSPAELTLLRFLVHLPLNVVIILANKDTFVPTACELKYVLIKGMVVTFEHLCLYTSFLILPYFDSFVIAYAIMVVSSIILGRIWLKERISLYVLTAIIVVVTGIFLIGYPAFEMKIENSLGYLCSVGSGIFMGVSGCVNRKIKETPATTVAFYISVCALPITIVATIIENSFKLPDDFSTIFLPVFIGFCSVATHVVWAKGLQLSGVSKIMLAVQCETPFALLLQWVFFHEIPHYLCIVGSCCISLAVVSLIFEDAITSLVTSVCGSV